MESSKKKSLILLGIILTLIVIIILISVFTKKAEYKIEIKVKDYGSIYATLYTNKAPITVENFISLIKDKFYDNLTFHRVVENFMIQGGDPIGTGTGGSEKTIKGEFSNNGYSNSISHTRGTLSMARTSNDMNSASSQFFIMQKDVTSLDGSYAAFGKVTKGMDIVDLIAKNTKVEDENGTVLSEKQPVIEYIR